MKSETINWEKIFTHHIYDKRLGRSQDGGGIGRGDHFLSYKFMERTIER